MNEQTKHLIEERMSSSRLLESIKISDTVHSWLNMLNRVIDVCNVVDYPNDDPATTKYANVFGFMESTDKLYLDGVKAGIFPTEDLQAIDVDARNLHSRHFSRFAVHSTLDSTSSSTTATVVVNKNAVDIQCIDARSNILLELTASPDPAYYSEKLVSICAKKDVHIEYSGNNFRFVNNSIYPNVEYSSIGTPKKTLLLTGSFILYRIIFIHSLILLEVVDNNQLVDNYKAASAKAADPSFNGELEFDASAEMLGRLTTKINEGEYSSFYMNSDGVVGTTYSAARCKAEFSLIATENDKAQWSAISIVCRPQGSNGSLLNSSAVELQNGRHIAQCWSSDRTKVVKIDYALNMDAKSISILGFSVVVMNSGRTYDE